MAQSTTGCDRGSQKKRGEFGSKMYSRGSVVLSPTGPSRPTQSVERVEARHKNLTIRVIRVIRRVIRLSLLHDEGFQEFVPGVGHHVF